MVEAWDGIFRNPCWESVVVAHEHTSDDSPEGCDKVELGKIGS
jgi:hypothetical protein